ncbi:MAG: anhydro-N-acetylmuramic acid kinase [Bacteroidetes bacterium OLB11]|nr:MAG: anhydro-N-acetylmuramic acid kinase [Bacteroidetes bacterium OLB11]
MSGSSMDGLDIIHTTIEEVAGTWSFTINHSDCIPFDEKWHASLPRLTALTGKELLLAHTEFGRWMGNVIHDFIIKNHLEHKVHLIASHGHTVFHEPQQKMTFQLGDGASIAAINRLPVISDLRNMDIALGGQGAPIVPIGEKYFWNEFHYFLNIGGICNITMHQENKHIAFDICPANRVLNLLCNELGKSYDHDGVEAAKGSLNEDLLNTLNDFEYYQKPYPKSLSNEFGVDIVFQKIQQFAISNQDKLNTYCEHIAMQIANVCPAEAEPKKMMITGGGGFNQYLIKRISFYLKNKNIEVFLPEQNLIEYKEALIMALIGVLRWREEQNALGSVTGATRNSIGGALWMGQD